MFVKTALSDGDLRSAMPMDERISYFPRRLVTRLLIHSATPDNTGQALCRKNASLPVTSAQRAKARAISSETWSSRQAAEPGIGAASSPDDGALSQGNCRPRRPIRRALLRADSRLRR